MTDLTAAPPGSSPPAADYHTFLHRKTQLGPGSGFEPLWLPDFLFAFQRHLVDWAVRRGRAAIFADCGLGKTPMQLVWAENVARKTGGRVMIITPLAVAPQTAREGVKFGVEASVSRDGTPHRITLANYESLHKFDPADFAGAVADESSAIKAFDGRRRKQVVRFFAKLPYRLLCSATPAPNDFIELGTQSECLGVMHQSEMLGYFFKEVDNKRHTVFRDETLWEKQRWSFKPHSEQPFWRWVSSWARAVRSPSDLGFPDDGFILPPLTYRNHVLDIPFIPPGELFHRPAVTIREQKQERKNTVAERCDYVASLVNAHDRPAIAWCHLNDEGTTLARLIPGAVEVAGRHGDDFKEAALNDFATGNIRVLVTKPTIGCWGMNYQHCGDVAMFPSFSFEQTYQAVRRCWRFGRVGPVDVDIVSSLGESEVMTGLERKQRQAETMFGSLAKFMNDALAMSSEDRHFKEVTVPPWITRTAS